MSKSKIFIGLCIAFALGVLLGSKFNIRLDFLLGCLGLIVLVFFLSFKARANYAAALLLFLFCIGLGVLRIHNSQIANEYETLFNSRVQLEGYVTEEPDVRQDRQLLTFRPKNFSQNILITTSFAQEYFYGDYVALNGKITQSQSFDTFDYPKYLERFNIYALSKYPKILILKSHQLSPLKEGLLKIKTAFVTRISHMLSQPQGSLLLGILIGARKSLPQDIVDNFNATGTSHIIAISGFNITIIISALAFLAGFLGRKASFWATLGIIAGFVIITGASASIIRASIMGALLLLSFRIGRQYYIAAALFASALVMLVLNPKILFWDIGFQLSFAATLGIVYFMPLLERLTENWHNPLRIKSIFFTTMSAIFATLPLMLLHFGSLSLVAPLVNILILTYILPATMLFGFLIVLPWAGAGFAFVTNFLLLYILRVTQSFAQIPYSSVQLPITNWTFFVLIFIIFAVYFILHFFAYRKANILATVE